MSQFVEATRTGGAAPVSGFDGRVSVEIALAAQKIFQENSPVMLTESGRLKGQGVNRMTSMHRFLKVS